MTTPTPKLPATIDFVSEIEEIMKNSPMEAWTGIERLFRQVVAQKDLERAEAVENALRKSSPGREMYQLGLKDGAKEERERLEKRFDDLEFISSFQKKQLKEDIFEALKETKAV